MLAARSLPVPPGGGRSAAEIPDAAEGLRSLQASYEHGAAAAGGDRKRAGPGKLLFPLAFHLPAGPGLLSLLWLPPPSPADLLHPRQGGREGLVAQFSAFSHSQPGYLQAIQSRDGVQLQYSQGLIEKDQYRKRVRALEEERDELLSKLSQAEGLNSTLEAQLQRCQGGRSLGKVRVARKKREQRRQRAQD